MTQALTNLHTFVYPVRLYLPYAARNHDQRLFGHLETKGTPPEARFFSGSPTNAAQSDATSTSTASIIGRTLLERFNRRGRGRGRGRTLFREQSGVAVARGPSDDNRRGFTVGRGTGREVENNGRFNSHDEIEIGLRAKRNYKVGEVWGHGHGGGGGSPSSVQFSSGSFSLELRAEEATSSESSSDTGELAVGETALLKHGSQHGLAGLHVCWRAEEQRTSNVL